MVISLELANFNFKDRIYISRHSQVIRAIRKSDQKNVIIKKPQVAHPSPAEIATFHKEYKFLSRLNHPGIIKVIDFINEESQWILVLEDVKGVTLKQYLEQRYYSTAEFLKISRQIVETMAYIHQQNIIHNDLKPDNILVTATGEIKIIDFSIATDHIQNSQEVRNNFDVMGTLEYLSPELTGRTNCALDARSDLYCLGVTFFEMLTGRVPFSERDPLDLIYAHLAKPAPNPASIKPNIPSQIAQIVLKLLSKDPKDRYQTASGLLYDLDICYNSWQIAGTIEPFILGEQDQPAYLQISAKLYGREKQIDELNYLLNHLFPSKAQMLFLKGPAGIGKSSLIREIASSLILHRALLLEGKFDQIERSIPFSGFVSAIRKLCYDLLGQPEEEINTVRQAILESIDGLGQVIINLIPEVEWIIGPQPQILNLAYTETQDRFNSVIQKFLQALSTPEKPLVLFLDDIMWADMASLTLIEKIVPSVTDCLFIGAFRSNEVSPAHPLSTVIQNLKDTNKQVTEMTIVPLAERDIEAMLRDTFNRSSIQDLAHLMLQKTEGNPFFVKELLRYLYDKQLIRFNMVEQRWEWDIEEIRLQKITENVVELMMGKISSLSPPACNALSTGAAMGVEFDLQALAQVLQKNDTKISEDLDEALKAELITITRQQSLPQSIISTPTIKYAFCHDRIQQAAYELIPTKDRSAIHLKIAKLGLSLAFEELVSHYNRAWDLLTDKNDQRQLIDWNIQLAQKARLSTAHTGSLDYLLAAEKLAPNFDWETDTELLCALFREKAELLCFLARYEEADSLFAFLQTKVKNRTLLAPIYCLRSLLFGRLGKITEWVDEGLKGLALYGIYFPKKVTKVHILWAIMKVKATLQFTTLERLQPMTDPDAKNILALLNSIFMYSYLANPYMFMLINAKTVQIILKYGYPSSLVEIFLAAVLFVVIKDYKTAGRFYHFGRALREKMDKIEEYGVALVIRGSFLDHWFNPFPVSLESVKEGLRLVHESGSYFWSSSPSVSQAFCYVRMGTPLSKLEAFADVLVQEFEQTKKSGLLPQARIFMEFAQTLLGRKKINKNFVDDQLQSLYQIRVETFIHASNSLVCIHYYIMEDYSTAIKYAMKAFPLRPSCAGSNVIDIEDLFAFLAMAKKNTYSREMRMIEQDAKIYAETNPVNYEGGYMLILAEKNRIAGRPKEAYDYFDKAIVHFQNQKCPHLTAVAEELMAILSAQEGRTHLAKYYLRESYYHYELWECRAKTELMEKNNPEVFFKAGFSTSYTSISLDAATSTHTSTPSGMIDFLSVLRASQAISEEMNTDKLMDKIMKAILANTGAQRGVILIDKRNQLFAVAETLIDVDMPMTQAYNVPYKEFVSLPHTLLAYVHKTHEEILINSPDAPFANDPYFASQKIKAALCVPIRQHGKEIGIVYLEHYANSQAFVLGQLKALHLLVAQAAISLENARLYTAYKRFVPSEFLTSLNRNAIDIMVGDQIDKVMTVLFADIRSFTMLSETMSPQGVFELINQFLGHCSPIVRKWNGFVDKYIGDAIMALFPSSAEDALQASIEIIKSIDLFNQQRQARGETSIHIGIGINTGLLTLGIIGEEQRIEGSVLGDTVNIASHIESLNKVYGTSILLSGETKVSLQRPDNYKLTFVDHAQLKGKRKSVDIWSLEA